MAIISSPILFALVVFPDSFDQALSIASKMMSVSKSEWLFHGNIGKLMRQKTISDFF